MPVKRFTPNWHVHLIERILHDIISVKLVDSTYDCINIWLMRFREEQELCACQSLEALHSKGFCLEYFYAGVGDIVGGQW
jgi:hypothetical protein